MYLVLMLLSDAFDIANKAIDATYKFFESINIPMHLKDVGIDESRIGWKWLIMWLSMKA